MKPTTDDFGAAIRKQRKKLKLTQTELAHLVGVHGSYIGKMEMGRSRGPSVPVATKVAEVLGLEPTKLLALAGRVSPDVVISIARENQHLAARNETLKGKVATLERRLRELEVEGSYNVSRTGE